MYVNKVNEMNKEFYYAHPLTKVKINRCFNTHSYGPQLWDVFNDDASRLEKTWENLSTYYAWSS